MLPLSGRLQAKAKESIQVLHNAEQSHPDFAGIIESCWHSLSFPGSKMFLVSKKLKEIKSIIRAFSKENFSDLEKRVTESFLELQASQQALLANPTPAFAILERKAHKKWIMLAKAEESFLRQGSRIQWLADGDINSAFFHRAIRSRAAQNFISMLLDSNDAVIDDPQDIKAHIIEFYQGLLGCPAQTTASSPDLIADLVPYRCSTDVVNILSQLLKSERQFFLFPKINLQDRWVPCRIFFQQIGKQWAMS